MEKSCNTDDDVEAFIAEHPDGATLAEIAGVLGVSHQAVRQLEHRAMLKVIVGNTAFRRSY